VEAFGNLAQFGSCVTEHCNNAGLVARVVREGLGFGRGVQVTVPSASVSPAPPLSKAVKAPSCVDGTGSVVG
jgi:hypothetical protein